MNDFDAQVQEVIDEWREGRFDTADMEALFLMILEDAS